MNLITMFDSGPSLRRGLFAILLAIAPTSALAQVGRIFVSAEAYVGAARGVHIGKIVELKPIENYGKPLTEIQKIGKPHRLIFDVSETIRGAEVERLELVLSLQSTLYLDCMREHAAEVMLVAGPIRLDSYPSAEIGIEEQGNRVNGDWFQFRLLTPVELPETDDESREIVAQLNRNYDACRMFTNEFGLVAGRDQILKRARAFAEKHRKMLPVVTPVVPNEFGALCGSPNAYCGITLPVCPETKATLLALQNDPGVILRQIESRDEDWNIATIRKEVAKALAKIEEFEAEDD